MDVIKSIFKWIIDNTDFLQFLVVLVTAIGGYIKYRELKNREIYEKRLREVYAPLFQLIARQELLRKIVFPHVDVEEAPIISITHRTTNQKLNFGEKITLTSESKESKIWSREEYINTVKGINSGLASPNLLTLISLYDAAVYLEENTKKFSDIWVKSTIIKTKIELDLYEEILKGYNECMRKLKLDKVNNIKNNRLIIRYDAYEHEISTLKENISKREEEYQ
jgi:hypothetical protein